MKRKKPTLSFVETIRRIKEAGLQTQHLKTPMRKADRTLPDIGERVLLIEAFVKAWERDVITKGMLFFVMYDIEDHKIRRHLAKYLQKQGCTRVQKSVFLGNTDHATYKKMADTLRDINAMYENGDSILILPITRESITGLNVIGKNVDYELTVSPPNVLII